MPAFCKPSQYESKILMEFDRLWINKTSVMVVPLGRDYFTLTDGNRSIQAKGHIILRVLKKLSDRGGYSKIWGAFEGVEGVRFSSSKKIIITTND